MKKQGYYVGIDIDDAYAVVSFYQSGMKEPGTVSMIAGSEVFQIPVLVAKGKENGQWFVGDEAKRIAETQQMTVIDALLEKAVRKEEILIEQERYQAKELLILFLKKMLTYAAGISALYEPQACAVSLEQPDKEYIELFAEIGERLGFEKDELFVLDRKTAFYYFALNQQKELWLHDVYLFDYRGDVMKCICLHRNTATVPQMITISEQEVSPNAQNKDASFYGILQSCVKGQIISAVYLVGNGFDGEWMKRSLAYLCRGRRVFIGKNLYAKGCCYAVTAEKKELLWPYLYISENEIKVNVSLKVRNQGIEAFYPLLRAGDNRYEAEGSCEVILSDTRDISIWLQVPNSSKANVETLTLSDLPPRECKTTRLRITAKPQSDSRIKIEIKDLGFGEIVRSSGLSWEYNLDYEKSR